MEETKETVAETPVAEEAAAPKAEQKKPKKSKEKELLSEIDALKASLAEKDDKYLRLLAEYDNFRRRSTEEKRALYGDALADTLKALLPILDDLERASLYTEAEKVAEGLQILSKSAQNAMEKLGVTVFGTAGDLFDANLHNAVMHTEDDALGEGVITEVFQKGYKKGDKVIRYAMVKVAN